MALLKQSPNLGGLQGTASSTSSSRQAGPTARRAHETPSPAPRWQVAPSTPPHVSRPPALSAHPAQVRGRGPWPRYPHVRLTRLPTVVSPEGSESLCPAPRPRAWRGASHELRPGCRLPMTRRDPTPTAAPRDVTSQTLASPSVRWKQSSPPGTRGQWRDGRRGRRHGVTPATSASGTHVAARGRGQRRASELSLDSAAGHQGRLGLGPAGDCRPWGPG